MKSVIFLWNIARLNIELFSIQLLSGIVSLVHAKSSAALKLSNFAGSVFRVALMLSLTFQTPTGKM